ncbi:MAG: cytochrome C peroxidase [Deltaproteobacteria bacterium]|nr:MAG: cytochrome C peroxidase [Deltaproteobacteria bacterium]
MQEGEMLMTTRLFFTKGQSRVLAVMLSLAMIFGSSLSAVAALPPSLKTVPTPEPVNLGLYLNNTGVLNAQGFPIPTQAAKDAAIALGKALFWDMQVGSDGQACASCHFQAGADNRFRNQINPGLNAGDVTFQVAGPNLRVFAADFPFTQPVLPDEPVDPVDNPLVRSINDVMSSMGVFFTAFVDIIIGANAGPGFPDLGTFTPDPVFHVNAKNTRRVEPRNTPTTINAVFNFSNFWDGRARNIFNGVNPFGELDPDARIFVNDAGPGLTPEIARIPDASLASQAVGPPLSDFEMSFAGRTFPDLGNKMLQAALQPLAGQPVAADDSVFGLPNAVGVNLVDPVDGLLSGAANPITPGENLYVTLIKQAFQPRYWDSAATVILPVAGGTQVFTQMEANFSLFWGLAVQLYEATLRSDDTKFDQFLEGTATLTSVETRGMNIFFSGGSRCAECHFGPEFTDHSVAVIRGGVPATPPFFLPDNAIEVGDAEVTPLNPTNQALFDQGIYNIAVRPTAEDIGRGGNAPSGFPLAFSRLALLKAAGTLPAAIANFVPNLPPGAVTRTAVDGAFKVPGLRNVDLTGPYMHNGGMSTLMQVVEFYTRGGNFRAENADNLDQELKDTIGKLQNDLGKKRALVAFLRTLTDNRVKIQSAPFDHPTLFVPRGNGKKSPAGVITENVILLPATGRNGDAANPLRPFLGLNPQRP